MSQSVSEMLQSSPKEPFTQSDVLARCIEACFRCAQVCTGCADACLGEESVKELRRCIRLDLDCADICATTGRLLSRQQEVDVDLLARAVELCALACAKSAEECESHMGKHEHCRICAAVCRECEQRCRELLASLNPTSPQPLQ